MKIIGNKSLTFDVKKVVLSKIDDTSFLGLKLWAIAEGKNRNNVDFTLSSIEDCIPSVYNKPILAAFNKSKDEFEAHNDNGLKTDEEGNVYTDYDSGEFMGRINEKAVGLIPLDSAVQIEKYKKKNWLTFNGLIWTKYSHKAVQLLKKLGKEKISVEVTITDWEEEDDVIVVNKFIFDGVTIIGVPEGIEGAHLKVGQFAQTDVFNEFQKAFTFAYNNKDGTSENENLDENDIVIVFEEEGDKDIEMKFDLKGMGMNDFDRKIREALSVHTYKSNEGYEYSRYWVYDVFPDGNYAILEDCVDRKLIKATVEINDDRDVVVDIDNAEEVEITYAEATYKTKFDFSAHLLNKEQKINIDEGEEEVMDVKFKSLFIENGYTPTCKFDKFVLFTKKEEDGVVYKLELDVVDKCSDENFGELLSKFEKLEEKPNEDMVSKLEFDSLVEGKKQVDEALVKEKEKYSLLDTELQETKAQLNGVNEKFAKLEFEKFKEEANSYIEKLSKSFGEEKDIFTKNVADKIESKDIKDISTLKSFVGEQLVDYNERKLKQDDEQFSLPPKKDPLPNEKDSVLSWM